MSVAISSVVLALAWFTAVNLVMSAATCAVALLRPVRETQRPMLLLWLRLAPSAAAALFVLAVFLPAHASLEVAGTEEQFGFALLALAAIAVAMLGASAWRVGHAVRVCRQLRASFASASERIGDQHVVTIPGLPGVSLAGLFRTTILVGSVVREALTSEELAVAIAHETAHLRAQDNLKRLAMVAAPDFFRLTPTAGRLEQQWRDAVECAADSNAVAGDEARAITLASALVKVARLSETRTRGLTSPVWSTFYEGALLEFRVRRLVAGVQQGSGVPMPTPLSASMILFAAIAAAWAGGLPVALHQFSELLIRILP